MYKIILKAFFTGVVLMSSFDSFSQTGQAPRALRQAQYVPGARKKEELVNNILKPDSVAVNRIADFGKVWGVINYFHPSMGKGILNADSLLLNTIGNLLKEPSAVNFKNSLNALFAKIDDPNSGIIKDQHPAGSNSDGSNSAGANTPGLTVVKAHTGIAVSVKADQVLLRNSYCKAKLPSGELYVAVPQKIFKQQLTLDALLNFSLPDQAFIIDLRNDEPDQELGARQYLNFVQPLLSRMIRKTMELPTARSFYYHGLMREDFQHDFNILSPDQDGVVKDHLQVFNGFRNIANGSYLLPAAVISPLSQKKFCFIVNRYVNINTLKALMALRNRNACRLIFEGELPEYILGDFYTMHLSDNVTVKIKTSEILYEDGTTGTKPDIFVPVQQDTSLNAPSIVKALQLLKKPFLTRAGIKPENTIFIRKPQYNYPTAGVPDARLRLLGLFNFWNAVYYFSPNKELISFDWSKALPSFIPEFLAAKTEPAYFLALMRLTASINDGHSLLINTRTGRSPVGFMDGNLPIGTDLDSGKVYITSILPDTTQAASLAQLSNGDELMAIDGVPVAQLAAQWKPYIVASNTAGFNREYYTTWLTSGTIGSTAILTVRNDGVIKKISLHRIKRDDYYALRGKVVRVPVILPLYPPYCKILEGNIGYLRVHRIYTKELDSLAGMLKNCKRIILDARGYPRDGMIASHLASYMADKTDTVDYNVFPFVVSPDLSENYMITEYEVIKANKNPDLKNKKYYILVDEGNQSQSEGGVIALQGVTNATTIGTQTAGANGMAVTINFPGEYMSFFSGFGEYYMDHTPNQKLGVKIDVQVHRTLDGYIKGKDEIMEKALEIAMKP